MSRKMEHRGAARAIFEAIRETFSVGEVFTVESIQGFPHGVVSSSLNYLANKGMLLRGEIRGSYRLPAVELKISDDEVVVIDNLLNAMAAAEPVLKKYKPIITVLRSMR